jgi:hypothetical protein
MSFCLTERKKEDSDTVDINTLMFVCLHEMSHIATASIGRGTEFWTNFKFILEEAQSIGIYDPQNYWKSQLKGTAPWKSTPHSALWVERQLFLLFCTSMYWYYKDVLYNSRNIRFKMAKKKHTRALAADTPNVKIRGGMNSFTNSPFSRALTSWNCQNLIWSETTGSNQRWIPTFNKDIRTLKF